MCEVTHMLTSTPKSFSMEDRNKYFLTFQISNRWQTATNVPHRRKTQATISLNWIMFQPYFSFHGATDPSGPAPPLPDKTQQSQAISIRTPGGIRTHNPTKPAAAKPRLRPRGHWDRLHPCMSGNNTSKKYHQGTQSYLTLHFLVILHV